MRFAIDALCHAIAFIVDEFSVVARGDLFAVACFCTVSRAPTRTRSGIEARGFAFGIFAANFTRRTSLVARDIDDIAIDAFRHFIAFADEFAVFGIIAIELRVF